MTASTHGIVTILPSRDSEMVDEGRRLQGPPDPEAALRKSLHRNNVVDDRDDRDTVSNRPLSRVSGQASHASSTNQSINQSPVNHTTT